ncbi:MAG: DNA repair protein RadC [Pirellulales bacterium]
MARQTENVGQTEDVERYERYAQVVKAAQARDRFTLAEIKQVCAWENPAFVTRVIHKLEEDAILKHEPAERLSGRRLTPIQTSTHVSSTRGKYAYPTASVCEDVLQWQVDPRKFSAAQWLDQNVIGHRLLRLPTSERPRERLLAQGPGALRTGELLAILIRIGRPGESALEAGETIARRFADCLEKLPQAGHGELRAFTTAVGKAAFCQIAAGIELGKRVAQARTQEKEEPLPPRLNSPETAIAYCRDRFQQLVEAGAQEEFHVVTLDTKLRPLDSHRVSLGLLDQAMVHPREVFRHAIQDAAKAILLVHNHPSGDPEPSAADLAATRQLEDAGKVIGIEVIDHLVVARQGVVSLKRSLI